MWYAGASLLMSRAVPPCIPWELWWRWWMDPFSRFRGSLTLAFNFVLYVFLLKNIKLMFFLWFWCVNIINKKIYIFKQKIILKHIMHHNLKYFLVFTPWDIMNSFLLVNVSYTSIYPFVCWKIFFLFFYLLLFECIL